MVTNFLEKGSEYWHKLTTAGWKDMGMGILEFVESVQFNGNLLITVKSIKKISKFLLFLIASSSNSHLCNFRLFFVIFSFFTQLFT